MINFRQACFFDFSKKSSKLYWKNFQFFQFDTFQNMTLKLFRGEQKKLAKNYRVFFFRYSQKTCSQLPEKWVRIFCIVKISEFLKLKYTDIWPKLFYVDWKLSENKIELLLSNSRNVCFFNFSIKFKMYLSENFQILKFRTSKWMSFNFFVGNKSN